MKKLTTTVTYKVPNGVYCNHTMNKSTPLTRCRFATEITKGHFTCVLHNIPLAVINGGLIEKTEACLTKAKMVEEEPAAVKLDPKKLIKYAVDEYREIYLDLVKQGAPDKLAHKTAKEEVSK